MIRTLKGRIFKFMAAKNTKQYVDALPNIVKGINNTISRAHKLKPVDVSKKNETLVFQRLYPKYKQKRIKFMFDVGTRVRFSKFRSPFHKSYKGNWSENIYVISDRIPRSPPVYKLIDENGIEIAGTFYGPELIKAGEKKDVKKEESSL